MKSKPGLLGTMQTGAPFTGALESSAAARSDLRATAEKPKVRDVVVTDIEVHRVKVNALGNWVLVRTKTSDGVTSVGDASHGGSDASKLLGVELNDKLPVKYRADSNLEGSQGGG